MCIRDRNGSVFYPAGSNYYLPPTYTTPTIGVTVYYNTSLTSIYNGGGNYHLMYKSGTYWAVQIGTNGIISDVVNTASIPSDTPTPTPTPTNTPTQTPTNTPTNTSTQTPTPSVTTPYQSYSVYYDGSTAYNACNNGTLVTLYWTLPGVWGNDLEYWTNYGVTLAPDGYYSQGGQYYQISGGNGNITTPNSPGTCPAPTPTPTPTPTKAVTSNSFSLGRNTSSAANACSASPSTYYSSAATLANGVILYTCLLYTSPSPRD